MRSPADPHRWTGDRLAALELGLLAASEESQVRLHLAACELCTRRAAALRDPDGRDVEEHVPSAVFATWSAFKSSARGLERRMVRRHLERCTECRQDLESLGFAPVLEIVPELEETTPEAGAWPVDRDGRTAAKSRGIDWWRWALAGWGTAASAAALVLALRVTGGPAGAPDGRPPVRDSVSLPTAAPPRLLLSRVARSEARTRSAPGAPETVRVSPLDRSLTLVLPPVIPRIDGVEDSTMVRLEWTGSGAMRAQSDLMQLRDLFAKSRVLTLDFGAAPVTNGDYVVRILFPTRPSLDPHPLATYRIEPETPAEP